LFHSVYGHQDVRIDSVMRPRSSSRGRNTSASVTDTVTRRFKISFLPCALAKWLLHS